jgi:hypothetical protein
MFRRLTLLAAVFALAVSACGGDDSQPDGFGAPVTDGFFTFTVNGFDCGAVEVSRGSNRRAAQSEYCLLRLTVTNTGEGGRRFDYEAQRLLGEDDVIYVGDLAASLIVNPDLGTVELQPGDQLDLTVVFDVANPVAVTDARLHDGVFSEGVLTPVRP